MSLSRPRTSLKVLGSLTPGRYADIVVLSKNIMTIREDEIPTARVDPTILGGQSTIRAAHTTTAARAGWRGC